MYGTGDNTTTVSIGNYSYFYNNEIPRLINCRSGLLLTNNNASFLGGWYYNGQPIGGIDACRDGNSFITTGPSFSTDPGVLPMTNCRELAPKFEGIYTCIIRDVDLIVHELQVGMYFDRGGEYDYITS